MQGDNQNIFGHEFFSSKLKISAYADDATNDVRNIELVKELAITLKEI